MTTAEPLMSRRLNGTTTPKVIRAGMWPADAVWALDRERRGFLAAGCSYELIDTYDPRSHVSQLRHADAIVTAAGPWTCEVIDQLERCKVLHACLIGLDGIDLVAASRRGIKVSYTPDLFVEEVAAHATALILACLRRLVIVDRDVRAGLWDHGHVLPMPRWRGATLGLLAFGRIPRMVALHAAALGMRVLAYDPLVHGAPDGLNVEMVSFERLFAESDVVSCHVPLTPETEGLVDAAAFRLMKSSAYFVNTSRGRVIDELALIAALRDGRLAGAALDVFATEPPDVANPLLAMPNVILSPHVAGYSEEVLAETADRAVEEVRAVLAGGTPTTWANRATLGTPRLT